MAKPNYQFEKRQRELEKQKKKAAKANKKSARDGATPSDGNPDAVPPRSTDAGPGG